MKKYISAEMQVVRMSNDIVTLSVSEEGFDDAGKLGAPERRRRRGYGDYYGNDYSIGYEDDYSLD